MVPALSATSTAAVNRNRKPRREHEREHTAEPCFPDRTQEAPLSSASSSSSHHAIPAHHPNLIIVVIVIILIVSKSDWSLAESISKSNATSVRSPDGPPPTDSVASLDALHPLHDDTGARTKRSNATSGEPVGFRKLKFFGDELQVLQFSTEADTLEDFMVCMWLRLENTTSNITLFSYHPMSDSASANGTLRWWVSNNGSLMKMWLKNKLVMKVATRLGDGKWRHVCQDWSGSSGNWTLHITGFKPLSGNVEHRGQNWILPGTGRVRISSEKGDAEIYGFTIKQRKSIVSETPENIRRDARQTKKEIARIKNDTLSSESNQNKTTEISTASNRTSAETDASSTEDPPEVFNSTAEAFFWNRGSSRQVEVSRGFSFGRAAAFLTRVIAFAIIPAMAIINEMRKNRAKDNEIKSIGSNNDDDDFKSFKIDSDYVPVLSSTTTKAPEKVTSPVPAFNTDGAGFDNFNFGGNSNNFPGINGNNPQDVDDIDPFFAQDNDFYRSAENKQVQTKSVNQTRTSRSHSPQCQSNQLLVRLRSIHGNDAANGRNNISIAEEDQQHQRESASASMRSSSGGVAGAGAGVGTDDLALIGSYCCWSDSPDDGVLVSWFRTPIDHIDGGAKLIDVSKSKCGTY